MLLNYLFANFYDEAELPEVAKINAGQLRDLMQNRVMPKPSYIVDTRSDTKSFVSRHHEPMTYRFHLKGHIAWLEALGSLGISTEERAKTYFHAEYKNASRLFFSGPLGQSLCDVGPELHGAFDAAYFEATWQNFLDGVYGVCTRSGMPKDIFLKQVLVIFIEQFIEKHPDPEISIAHCKRLEVTVRSLNMVESEFAPHEVSNTSRQRCIIDVMAKYLPDAKPLSLNWSVN